MNNNKTKKNIWMYLVIAFPLLVDGIDFILFDKVNDWLVTILKTPSFSSVMIMISMYALFIITVLMIGLLDSDKNLYVEKSEPKYTVFKNQKENTSKTIVTFGQKLFFYPSIGFGVIMIVLIAHVTGIISDGKKSLFTDSEQNIILWTAFILFFIHVFAIIMPRKPKFKVNQPSYFMVLVPAVIIAAIVLNLSVAAWIYLLTPVKVIDPSRDGKILELFTIFPIFLLFFSSPRFLFMSREFTYWSLASAFLLMGYFVWSSLSYITLF